MCTQIFVLQGLLTYSLDKALCWTPRSPHTSVAMACGLDLARLRPLSLGLSHELSSIVWFLYFTDKPSFEVKMSHPCHLCCLGLLCANSLRDAGVLCPLTGVSNPSPSSRDEHMFFLCLRSILPQDQTTGHLTEQLSE